MIILYLNSPFHEDLEPLPQLTGIKSNGAHQFAIGCSLSKVLRPYLSVQLT